MKLFNCPCVLDDAPHRAYRGHSSHVMGVRFSADDRTVVGVWMETTGKVSLWMGAWAGQGLGLRTTVLKSTRKTLRKDNCVCGVGGLFCLHRWRVSIVHPFVLRVSVCITPCACRAPPLYRVCVCVCLCVFAQVSVGGYDWGMFQFAVVDLEPAVSADDNN